MIRAGAVGVCAGCGHDAASRCVRCGTDASDTAWTAGGAAGRYEFRSAAGSRGWVTVARGAVVAGAGSTRVLTHIDRGELPDEVRHLSSTHCVPYPLEIETAPTLWEIVTGSFVCAVMGLFARGALDLSLLHEVGWERRGTFVLATQAYEGAEPWVRRTSVGRDGALSHQQIEQALLASLREPRGEHAYRSRPDLWLSLDDVLAHATGLPDHEQVLATAEIVDFDRETLLEEIERTHVPLVRGLASLAVRLPVTGR